MYSKFSMKEEVDKAFKLIEKKDFISWNTLIAACSHCDDHGKGSSIFKEMTNGISLWLDDFTYASALAACAGIAFERHGKQIHAHLIRTKLDGDVGVDNALVNIHAKYGCNRYAQTVFNKMGCRNLVSWNSIIVGFGNHGHEAKALELFEQMKEHGLKPNSVTFIVLLTTCNRAGLVDKDQAYFNSINEIYGIAPDVEHFSCLIDLLGQAGRLKEAVEYIEKFPFGNDPVVLMSLLSAC
ncbi:Pentatricopeptide repeat-containing protein [Camellia lanceoleosa]|uniref:Pentatricopeptide repeat-containing protein n=1 Tax=Camellia lanceoleosa TaxID=1840588 RepID=A0ACC0IC49_9ERIC|nr:Pentatricopeptide repeat-containing protein [Camellia lanceoleosa]